jgi:hypothetical protein
MNKFTRILRPAPKPNWTSDGKSGRQSARPARNKNEIPVEVLQLSEDLIAIKDAIRNLESVDESSIGPSDTQEQRDFNRDMMRSTLALIRAWKYYATLSMRRKYLTP